MKRYIEDMRDRPEHHKQRFALAVSLGATALIAAVWATTLPYRFSLGVRSTTTPAAATGVAAVSAASGFSSGASAAPAPLEELGDGLIDVYDAFRETMPY